MPFDADSFAADLISSSDPTASIADGALDNSTVDFSPQLNVDFRNVGGLSFEADSAFFDAVQRGTDNMQGSLYATANAIGSLTGFDALADFGEEGFRDQMREAAMNPAQVESYEDVDSLATLGTYISEAVGENIMNMALMASGGGVGLKLTQAAIAKAAIQNMGKRAAQKAMITADAATALRVKDAATKVSNTKSLIKGARNGAAIPSYGLGAGEVQGEFIENGINNPGVALLAGIPIAGLDVFGLEKIIGVAFKGMPITSAKQLVTQAAKAFGIAGASEMPTEAAQELIGMVARSAVDPEFELFTEENFQRLADAGIKGGLAGGIMGGAGTTAVGVAKGLSDTTGKARDELKFRLGEGLDPADTGNGVINVPPGGFPPAGGGPTSAESTPTLQAGIDAIGRGGRKAAYSANPKGFDAAALPAGYTIIPAEDGGVYAAPQAGASVVMEMDKAGKQSEILGYASDKPTGGQDVTVVQSTDALGRTVQDVVTDKAGLDAAFAQGEQAAGPGGTISAKDPQQALADRANNFDDDATNQPREKDGTARIDPEDLIGALLDEVVQQEPVTVTTKHSTTQRIMNGLYGSESELNSDGTRDVTVAGQAPRQTQGDPAATHPLTIKAVAKVFDDGKTEERGRIEVANPFPTKKNKAAGVKTNIPVSLPSLIRLGRQLNQLNETKTDRKSNLLTGLAWLYENGFTPSKVRVKKDGKFTNRDLNVSNGKETRLGLPLNTVIDGREEAGTAVTFGDVMSSDKDAAKLKRNMSAVEKESAQLQETSEAEAAAIKEVSAKIDTLSARLVAANDGKSLSPTEMRILAAKVRQLFDEVGALRGEHKKTNELMFKAREAFNNMRDAAKQAGVAVTDGQFDAREMEQLSGNPEEEDTRRFPTDDSQAADSARASGNGKAGRARPNFLVNRNNKVAHSAGIPTKVANAADKVLKLLGIKTQINIVDEAGVADLLADMEAAKKQEGADAAFVKTMDAKITDLKAWFEGNTGGFIIYNDQYTAAEDRVPTIFISTEKNKKLYRQLKVLSHELGHLVQRAVFDQAPKDVQQAIRDSMAGTRASRSNTFEENFANMLWRKLMDLDATADAQEGQDAAIRRLRSIALQVNPPPTMEASDTARAKQLKDMKVVEQFFTKLAAKLRKLWKTLRDTFKVDEEYSEFVDAMVGVKLAREGKKPVTRLGKKYVEVISEITIGPYLPYRADAGPRGDRYSADDIKALKNKIMRDRRAARVVEAAGGTGEGVKKVWALAQEKLFKSADAFLRGLKSDRMLKMADQFHHQPGTKKTGRTFFEEKRYEMGQRQHKLDAILTGLPSIKGKGWWGLPQVDTKSGEYVQLMEMLISGVSTEEFTKMGGAVGEAGAKVRAYFDEMIAWQEAQGMSVRKRKNYFPAIAEKSKWETAEGQAKVRETFKRHGYSDEYAQSVIDVIIKGDGYLADTLSNDDSLLGPGFNFMKQRKLSPEVLADLNKDGMMVDDLGGVMQMYTHASIERGVTQRRWGLSSQDKARLQGEFKTLGIADQHLNSPVARLHLELARALRDEEITPEEFRTVKNKVLEAYFGRLGANIDPRWAKFQSVAIMYQNLRLLSLATLTALVDAGQIVWRSGDASLAFSGLMTLMNKSTREEMYEMAHLMGVVSDQVTEHVLNDQTTTQFMSPKMKRWNEDFFRMIGMAQWTSLTRVMGLTVGREFLSKNADMALKGDAKAIRNLEELGVTPDEIYAWQDDGFNVNDGAHGNVVGALDTFVDESIIRPDATVRPIWASDRHFQILFHLKSFMWGYQEVILRRIWNQAKNEPTKMRALQQGGMSAAILVAATLPLAAAGYEIRRLLSWWGNPPAQSAKHGTDYLIEVAERAGYLGLFQFIADAEQAADFGRLSILSAAGPSLSQLEEFLTDDYASIITRATPVLAQSGAARSIARDFLRGN